MRAGGGGVMTKKKGVGRVVIQCFFIPVQMKSARETHVWPSFDFLNWQKLFFTGTFLGFFSRVEKIVLTGRNRKK